MFVELSWYYVQLAEDDGRIVNDVAIACSPEEAKKWFSDRFVVHIRKKTKHYNYKKYRRNTSV